MIEEFDTINFDNITVRLHKRLFNPKTAFRLYHEELNSIYNRIEYAKYNFIRDGNLLGYNKCDDVGKELCTEAEKRFMSRMNDLSEYIELYGTKNLELI